MPRPKGSKDKRPRKLKEASINNLKRAIPGFTSGTIRIFSPTSDYRWFQSLSTLERGIIVTESRKRLTE